MKILLLGRMKGMDFFRLEVHISWVCNYMKVRDNKQPAQNLKVTDRF
jgi:hypothetical protein